MPATTGRGKGLGSGRNRALSGAAAERRSGSAGAACDSAATRRSPAPARDPPGAPPLGQRPGARPRPARRPGARARPPRCPAPRGAARRPGRAVPPPRERVPAPGHSPATTPARRPACRSAPAGPARQRGRPGLRCPAWRPGSATRAANGRWDRTPVGRAPLVGRARLGRRPGRTSTGPAEDRHRPRPARLPCPRPVQRRWWPRRPAVGWR